MSKSGMNSDQLKKLIREIPDFPKKGILFYDITTLLKDKTGYATLVVSDPSRRPLVRGIPWKNWRSSDSRSAASSEPVTMSQDLFGA